MKKIELLIIAIITGIILPLSVNAGSSEYLGSTYKTLSFEEALADEGIEQKFNNYSENDDQITIYLFRGKGCSFCRSYLTFMNSITEEYGKYFKMVTFEVWNDSANSSLMSKVSNFLNQPAEGVPYVIIGDQVFPGYASSYDDGIKSAIMELYNTKKEDRYDVFKAIENNDKEESKAKSSNGTTSTSVIVWNLVFVAVGTLSVICFNYFKFKELNENITKLSKKTK